MPLPNWAMKLDWPVINDAAADHGLDAKLIAAIIMTESGGNTYATRFEPNYRWVTPDVGAHAKRVGTTLETERIGQMTSWGLAQVMGSVAREHGFKGPLPELTVPDIGVFYGCAHLKSKYKQGVSLEGGIAAYNAGSARKLTDGTYENQAYVDKVLAYLNQL